MALANEGSNESELRESSSRNRDYAEILARLQDLQASKQERTPQIPLIDPTQNVINLVP